MDEWGREVEREREERERESDGKIKRFIEKRDETDEGEKE